MYHTVLTKAIFGDMSKKLIITFLCFYFSFRGVAVQIHPPKLPEKVTLAGMQERRLWLNVKPRIQRQKWESCLGQWPLTQVFALLCLLGNVWEFVVCICFATQTYNCCLWGFGSEHWSIWGLGPFTTTSSHWLTSPLLISWRLLWKSYSHSCYQTNLRTWNDSLAALSPPSYSISSPAPLSPQILLLLISSVSIMTHSPPVSIRCPLPNPIVQSTSSYIKKKNTKHNSRLSLQRLCH